MNDTPEPAKVADLDPDHPPTGLTADQTRGMIEALTASLAQSGDLDIPQEVRDSAAFRRRLALRWMLCLAGTGWVIYTLVSGLGGWMDQAGSAVACAWAWLITISAARGKVLEKPEGIGG